VASGGAAACRGAAPAGCAAGAGVSYLSGEGGHLPLRPGGFAFRAGDSEFFISAPEEDVECLSALPAFEFINRHGSTPFHKNGCSDPAFLLWGPLIIHYQWVVRLVERHENVKPDRIFT
jgi:hypothetical protein